MILYVNGDSHTAAAEAVNSCAFANDDYKYKMLKRAPHPENLAVSWGAKLALALKMSFACEAESASSNARIIRTTKKWIDAKKEVVPVSDILMVIQFSTWEREEWLHDSGEYFQVNASGIDDVPEEWQERYKKYIAGIDWQQKTDEAEQEIFALHLYLNHLGVKHIFFNGNNSFYDPNKKARYDYKESYIDPYTPEGSFSGYLQNAGHSTVVTSNYHFGKEAHSAWANHVLNHILKNEMIK